MAPQQEIYLDSAATTRLDPEVFEAMLPWLSDEYGNPSSIHAPGRRARAAIDNARDAVASLLGAPYEAITFTSGGTEANNLAVFGLASITSPDSRVLATAIEHPSVLAAVEALARAGRPTGLVQPSPAGIVTADEFATACAGAGVVCAMHANNEIGSVQPIPALAAASHRAGALFHVDAVQTGATNPAEAVASGADTVAISAHKMYGPKATGALYVRPGLKLPARQVGGAQERERRPGTENVAGIVGFGKAAALCAVRRTADARHVAGLRDELERMLAAAVPDLTVHASAVDRVPGILNFSVPGVPGSQLLINLDREGIAAASGAACSSGALEPSHVLRALGLPDSIAAGGVRFSLCRTTTRSEIAAAAAAVAAIVGRARLG